MTRAGPLRRELPGRYSDSWSTVTALTLCALLTFVTLSSAATAKWPRSVFQIGISALCIAWIQRFCWTNRKPVKSGLVLICAVPSVWAIGQLAAGTVPYRAAAWESVLNWSTLFGVFFLARSVCQSFRLRRLILAIMLLLSVVVTVFQIVRAADLPAKLSAVLDTTVQQIQGVPFSSNGYSEFVELVLPIALARALLERRHWLFYATVSALLFGTVISSGERMGSFLVTLEVITIIVAVRLSGMAAPKRWSKIAALVLLIAAFAVALGPAQLIARAQQQAFNGRLDVWRSALVMIRDRPLFGVGAGNFSAAYPGYARTDHGYFVNHVHNDWLEWATEGGIPYACLLLALAGVAARLTARTPWGIGVLAVLLHALVDFPLERIEIAGWWLVVLAALEARAAEATGYSTLMKKAVRENLVPLRCYTTSSATRSPGF